MPRFRFLAVTVALGALASCVAPPPPAPPPPRPAPAPAPVPLPAPAPTPAPSYSNWMDAPRTPGDWVYSDSGASSYAAYGNDAAHPLFGMRCDKARHVVSLGRTTAATRTLPMNIRTETVTRLFTATPAQAGASHVVRAELPAADSFLDAMALSKGRFAVEVAGEPTLYVPSWPEVTRVIEDCR
jgi:hypothetical protein